MLVPVRKDRGVTTERQMGFQILLSVLPRTRCCDRGPVAVRPIRGFDLFLCDMTRGRCEGRIRTEGGAARIAGDDPEVVRKPWG